MSSCTKQTCGDCFPLYRYFVNQYGVLENDGLLVSVPCPTGYRCTAPSVEITVEEGHKKLRPDIDPIDPDVNPTCDYDCERNRYRLPDDPYEELRPQIRVGNDEQTVSCDDVDPGSIGTASVTVPANTFIGFAPSLASVGSLKAVLNGKAKQKAQDDLLEQIAQGTENCYGWEYAQFSQMRNNNVFEFGVDFAFQRIFLFPWFPITGGETTAGGRYYYKNLGPFPTDVQGVITLETEIYITGTSSPPNNYANFTSQARWTVEWDGTAPTPSPIPGSTERQVIRTLQGNGPGTHTDIGTAEFLIPQGTKASAQLFNNWNMLYRSPAGPVDGRNQGRATIVLTPVP